MQSTPSMFRLTCIAIAALGITLTASARAQSTARLWNDLVIESIRKDFPRPTVHARNLFHTSAAMWDGWAAYDTNATLLFGTQHLTSTDREAARRESISYAVFRVLINRFATSPGYATMLPRYRALMTTQGFDPDNTVVVGDSPAAVGNRIGQAVIAAGLADGANQIANYANRFYAPINPPLIVALAGNPAAVDVRRYQPLALAYFIDQNGNPVPTGFPPFLTAEWGSVTPFAMLAADRTDFVRDNQVWGVYHDPGAPPEPTAADQRWRSGHEMVMVWSSHLDPSDGVVWDISPASMGDITAPTDNNYDGYYRFTEGGDTGEGYVVNPITGLPYAPQVVRRGDYARVLAEFWADGPLSETPPGHWFTILNHVMDDPRSSRRIGGSGEELNALEYEVKAYLALAGAMHDTAISVWSAKGWYDTARPISAIRWMCSKGQCSSISEPSYNIDGVHLVPGHIEVITAESTSPGQRHELLKGNEGAIAVKGWRGAHTIENPESETAGVGWILGSAWWPYQRPTFVTPPFGGYTSGHSAYSRAAAHVMDLLTGSKYFPGGLGEFTAAQNQYLVFEDGPSTPVTLQFASYFDAADQCALSRIWGGIHPPFDDIPSRVIGNKTGPAAFAYAQQLWGSRLCTGDITQDGSVDGVDLAVLLGQWGSTGSADINGDGLVDGTDLGSLLGGFGPCD